MAHHNDLLFLCAAREAGGFRYRPPYFFRCGGIGRAGAVIFVSFLYVPDYAVHVVVDYILKIGIFFNMSGIQKLDIGIPPRRADTFL